MFTKYERAILAIVASWRNYDNLESELNDNACGVYLRDIVEYTPLDTKTARGVLSSLIQKDMLYTDRVNGEMFFRATDKCLEYCYNVLDKEREV
jgi:hypothetical protein